MFRDRRAADLPHLGDDRAGADVPEDPLAVHEVDDVAQGSKSRSIVASVLRLADGSVADE